MPENGKPYQDRLRSLRTEIKKQGVDGFVLPRTDEFQGEFLAGYAERLAFLSGFTGSAGVGVVLPDKAVVMSDGRYTIQLKNQVDGSLYEREDSTKTSVGAWLYENADEGARIGYDPWLFTSKQIKLIEEKIEAKGIKLVPLAHNIVDEIWPDQPARPEAPVTIFPHDVAGKSSLQKREEIANHLKKEGASSCLITAGDSICWLLNVRGGDIDYSPLVLSYAVLHGDGSLDWFINQGKLSAAVREHIGAHARMYDFADIEAHVKAIKGPLMIDPASCPSAFMTICQEHGVPYIEKKDPCSYPKSIKSAEEQEAIRNAHIKDGVAVVKFLKWLETRDQSQALTELSVEARLEAFRREDSDYLGPSFSTIAGFASNGAIIHYRAEDHTNAVIDGDGLLLVDSGGQYRWGTTDITRTMVIGSPSEEMKLCYTRVLKGHIALAAACFAEGAQGKDIDSFARKPLKDVGLDYAHGTGHGVGCYLCVHEAASNISPRGDAALAVGMLISNEPGYYKEGEFGIRLENLVLVQNRSDGKLCFETVTYAPFEPALIIWDMLDESEAHWLMQYNEDVYNTLAPYLDNEHRGWLKARLF